MVLCLLTPTRSAGQAVARQAALLSPPSTVFTELASYEAFAYGRAAQLANLERALRRRDGPPLYGLQLGGSLTLMALGAAALTFGIDRAVGQTQGIDEGRNTTAFYALGAVGILGGAAWLTTLHVFKKRTPEAADTRVVQQRRRYWEREYERAREARLANPSAWELSLGPRALAVTGRF